jgi:hypothetical protein
MKQSEAVKHLRNMRSALKKYRTDVKEAGLPNAYLAQVVPWAFGDRCPLPALDRFIKEAEDGKGLAPGDYHNMMIILDRFLPQLRGMAAILDLDLPDGMPSMDLFKGWEPEE